MRVIKVFFFSFVMLTLAFAGDAKKDDAKAAEKTVYVTKTGEKYHSADCRYLKKSSIPISLEDAKKKYTACSVCKPGG